MYNHYPLAPQHTHTHTHPHPSPPLPPQMWRMAVDQLPNTSKELRGQVQRNIALAFVRAGHMGDALQQFEQAMEHAPSHVAGFNLVVCAYAAGDKERMKAAFQMLLRVRWGEWG